MNRFPQESSARRPRVHTLVVVGGMATACWIASSAAQTAPVHGTTKPAGYECSGLEGAALTSCMNLNAAAAQSAAEKNDTPSNSSHDCADMTGAALSTCMELNGQRAPATPSGAGSGNFYLPQGQTPAMTTGNGASTAAGSTTTGSTPLSGGSGNTTHSAGNNPTGLSAGSGATGSSNGAGSGAAAGGSSRR